MRHLVFFVHADTSVRGEYTEALSRLGDFDLQFVNAGNYSTPYTALGRRLRDRDGRVLPRLRAEYLSATLLGRKHDTCSVISFSAGYALVRELLLSPRDREAIDAVVMLDSLHAGYDPDGTAADVQLAPGFVPYAQSAVHGHSLLWVGHSDVQTPKPGQVKAYASTTDTAAELVRLVGGTGGNFYVRAHDVSKDPMEEHRRALADQGPGKPAWGPEFAAEALVPFLTGEPAEPITERVPWRDRTRSLRERCVALCEAELAAGVCEEPLGSNTGPRIRQYLEPAYRRATGKYLHLTAAEWCAAAQCFVQRECLFPGEAGAHGYYASGLELTEGCITVGTWRGADYVPRVGDLAILLRGSGWQRHVVRVASLPVDGAVTTLGGNENHRWQRSRLRLDDARITGYVAYP